MTLWMSVRQQPDGMSEANLQRLHRRPGATKSHMTDKKKRILGDYSKFYWTKESFLQQKAGYENKLHKT